MYLVFNCLETGLANNGGSRTLIHCQRVLRELGHKVDIIATADRFTWFEHIKAIKRIPPNVDWVIATACSSVKSTLQSHCKNKAWYIRAHETWHPKFNEDKLIQLYKNPNILKIVNSIWQKEFLESFGVNCHLVYQGVDLHLWHNLRFRETNKIPVIGCMYSTQSRKQWCNFVILNKILGKDFKYIAYGNKHPDLIPKADKNFLNTYLCQPDIDTLNHLYSMCDVWFAPTNSEGLHNPPMEASLCGCIICCSDAERNGMSDYAISDYSAMIYPDNDISVAAQYIREFVKYKHFADNAAEIIRTKINTREHNMKKFAKILKDNIK